MSEFLQFIDNLRGYFPIHLEIYYSKIMDWRIIVYKKGCAKDYPDSVSDGDNVILCDIQDGDMELAFAKAQVAVKQWLFEHNDGY